MDLIKTILTSGVIAAVITGLISFVSAMVSSNKEARLSRITDERKAWREEIRRIAEELSIINIDNDKDTITVEDPVGLSRVQNIKDYVSEYNSKFIDADKDSYFDVYFDPGIDIEIVTENENVYKNGDIENVFYIDPKNCSEGISLLKKQYNIGTIKTFTIKS